MKGQNFYLFQEYMLMKLLLKILGFFLTFGCWS